MLLIYTKICMHKILLNLYIPLSQYGMESDFVSPDPVVAIHHQTPLICTAGKNAEGAYANSGKFSRITLR